MKQTIIIPASTTQTTVDVETTIAITSLPPDNIPPVVNAGQDITITLPVNSVTLNGSGSDPDGTIASFLWTKISGTGGNIATPNNAVTLITGLAAGVYIFRLTATDNTGAITTDEAGVIVLPAVPPPNQPPVVNAGSNQSITLPVNSTTLNGTATDTDGSVVSTLWEKVSGSGTIVSPSTLSTQITGLTQGTSIFKLTATDNSGATNSRQVTVTVNPVIIIVPPPPGVYQGFGSQATGGLGQQVVHVTNLNSTGAGSLADAIKSNRYIVFDVGGTINNFRFDVGNNISGTFQNITIDGSTAPSPGITLNNQGAGGNTLGFENNVHKNIIIIGISAINAGNDNFHFLGCSNIVLANCFAVGAGDGNCDITDGANNITVQHCIFGGSVAGSMLIAYPGTKNISVHHNLFSPASAGNVGERNPLITHYSASDLMCDFRNNLVWKWGRSNGTGSGYGFGVSDGGNGQAINNYFKTVVGVNDAIKGKADPDLPAGKFFQSGNVSGNGAAFPASTHAEWTLPAYAQLTSQTAMDAAREVLANAGTKYKSAAQQALINAVVL